MPPSISFYGPSESIASGRYRVQKPAQYLYANGFDHGNDVLIISKHCWPENPISKYKKYIFDVCDDHFHTEHENHYREHCEKAALVTCNSDVMSEVIKLETGRDAVVIPDPIDMERKPPHYSESILWFGNKHNFKQVKRVMPDLPDLPIEIVSEPFNKMVTPWSLESMSEALDRAGVVIIPVDKDKPAKSANRMIEAINGGCFVVAEPLPCHNEFSDIMFVGDVGDGVDWYAKNPKEAILRVEAGQKYIDKYSIDNIGPMWAEAIKWVM